MSSTKKHKTQKRPAKKAKSVAKPYEPTEQEAAYVAGIQSRKDEKVPHLKLEIDVKDDIGILKIKHNDPSVGEALLLSSIGTTDSRFADGLMKQLANMVVGSDIEKGKQDFDFMFSVITAIEPKDEIEAMLAAQMAAVHMATMTFSRRLSYVETIDQQNSAERAFNKLTRTFTAQMEALNRHRGKGQQKMTVEHVNVHEGGQAIVGNVQGGGDEKKN